MSNTTQEVDTKLNRILQHKVKSTLDRNHIIKELKKSLTITSKNEN